MYSGNPAKSLLGILNKGINLDHKQPILSCWSKLLNTPSGRDSKTLIEIAKVIEMPDKVIQELKKYKPNHDYSNKHWFKKLSHAFNTQPYNGNWNQFISHIDHITLQGLEDASDIIDLINLNQSNQFNEDELLSIKKELQDILEEVMSSEDLEEDIKNYLAKSFKIIIYNIDEYRLNGIDPILDSLEMVTGHLVIRKYKGKDSSIIRSTLSSISNLANFLTVGTTVPQLVQTTIALIKNS